MTPLQQTLKYFITLLKINRVNDAKNRAVRVQDFAEAAKQRERESELEKELLSIEQLDALEVQLSEQMEESVTSSPDPDILVRALETIIQSLQIAKQDMICSDIINQAETALNNYKNNHHGSAK